MGNGNIDYSILSWNEAFESVFENGIEFHKPSNILKIENVVEIYLFYFSTGSYLVLPCQPVSDFSRNEYPAFLYHNREKFENAVEARQFPVPERFITLLKKERDSLKKIENTYQDYLAFFDIIMGTGFSISISKSDLMLTHSQIKLRKAIPQYNKLILAYSIVINRFLMQDKNASTIIITKNQGYFPSYVPCVKIEESIINTYESIGWEELESSFENCLTRILFSARPLLSAFKFNDGLAFIKYISQRSK